jgi:hypothetical protein
MRWKIYYRRGRTFSSEDGNWDDAPADGVLAIVEVVGERRRVVSGGDYYRLETNGEIVSHETADAILHAIGIVLLSSIKFGWAVSPREMAAVQQQIDAENWT